MLPRRAALPETPPLMWVDWFLLAGLTVWGLWWLAPGLDHPAIHNWDESFHQAVVRGTADSFFRPHMYVDPLVPIELKHWWYAGIWLHKATGVFWWGALMLKIFGVTTAALRSASLVGELSLAWMMFLFIRPLAGRALGFFCAAAFLLLPWGWLMVQGQFVAEVTDVSVAAFVSLAIACLWMAVEKDSNRWAFAAGAAVGVGFLCKTFLSLAPLGVAGAWWLLSLAGFCRGPRLKQVVLIYLGFIALAAPWNIYSYLKWPDVYMRVFDNTIGFINANSGEDIGSGARPPDAIFNEINFLILAPIPYPVTFLCGVWLAVSALRKRDGREVMLALWLWSTWLGHSFMNVKGHGHLWNMMPAGFVAYAVTLRDAFKHRALAAGLIASMLVWQLKPAMALVPLIKAHLPGFMVQTRTWETSNFVEQVLIVVPVMVAVALLGLALKRFPKVLKPATALGGLAACAGLFVFAFPKAASAFDAQLEKFARDDQWDLAQDVGVALDPVLDKKSVLFLDSQNDFGTNFEQLNLMFWSGRMSYRMPPDVALAQAKGYHPYLVSPAAEKFAPVPVPAFSQLRAYDLLAPTPEEAPLPDGLRPLGGGTNSYQPLGWAGRELDKRFSRYAFYVHPKGPLTNAKVVYQLKSGVLEQRPLQLAATLHSPARLNGRGWFIFPDVGPPLDDVVSITLTP